MEQKLIELLELNGNQMQMWRGGRIKFVQNTIRKVQLRLEREEDQLKELTQQQQPPIKIKKYIKNWKNK